MIRLTRGLGVATLAICAFLAFSAPGRSLGAVHVITPQSDALDLEMRKGDLVRLDHPVSAVFVADPSVADVQIKSPRLIYVFGKSVGETTLYAVDDKEAVVANFIVRVNHGLGRLRAAIKALAPEDPVQVHSIDRSLVLEGTVSTAARAEEVRALAARFISEGETVINRIAVDAPNQVNLRVRIAEVSRSAVKELGVNWDATLTNSSFLFGIATGNPVVAGSTFLTRNNGTNSIFGNVTSGTVDLNGLVDALNEEGLLTVLAEPNLTAMSGESASFLAGGEFPIPVPQDNNTITIEFKKFGVQLSFTPVLLSGGRISLRVAPEVSQLSASGSVTINNFVIPALTTRQAETTVELASGQSFAIAGLLQDNINHNLSKLPGLGDLPVLGSLFRSDSFQRDESELVIIVTPYLVRPVSHEQMASPLDGLSTPNDVERILEGRSYGRPSEAYADFNKSDSEGGRLNGPAGFMMD